QAATRFAAGRADHVAWTRHGVAELERLWDREAGGFFWGLPPAGRPTGEVAGEKSVYADAFAIYALAAAHRATGDEAPLALAQRSFEWLDRACHDDRDL